MRKTIGMAFAAGLLLAGCGGGGGGTTPAATTAGACSDLSSGSSFTVKAENSLKFVPDCIIAKNTQSLDLQNTGSITHTFTIVGTPVDVTLDGGKSQTLAPPGNAIKPGTYIFYCKFHGKPDGSGMAGKITVE
ncbi:MAG: cupredoxin domain-containing protein [Actinomycetota bacterium]